jgi:hypothetical protein
MKPLAVFYHIWSPPRTDIWKILVDEQLKLVQRCGLHEHADIATQGDSGFRKPCQMA